MPKPLSVLEKDIGYTFKNPELLKRAMTHRSWAFENVKDLGEPEITSVENETLEFVGDSVIGLAVAEELFNRETGANEGDLTLMKHHLVSTETLAEQARSIGLGSFLRVGRGEEKTGGRRKQALLANTFEALIAAVFFDGGYVAARSVIRRLLANEFKSVTPQSALDFKTLLQETLQADKRDAPVYNLLSSDGPSHEKIFTVEAVWDKGKTIGKGSAIKIAEMQAAKRALIQMGVYKN